MPGGEPRTERGRMTGLDERWVVRCFSQDGAEHRDFDLSKLSMPTELRAAFGSALVKRTALEQA